MGAQHTTYFAYGARVLEDVDPEVAEIDLGRVYVRLLRAGDYDQDKTFLVTECAALAPGEHTAVLRASFDYAEFCGWPAAIRNAAERLGVTLEGEPAWFVIPDLS
jgi:hypothetical protein